MAEKILHDHHATVGRVTLIPSSGGVHEVTLDGAVLHSKKESGKHPDTDAILEQIAG